MLNRRGWRPCRLNRLQNAIQETLEVRRNSLLRNFERSSEPNLRCPEMACLFIGHALESNLDP